jgi:hypothetical protein
VFKNHDTASGVFKNVIITVQHLHLAEEVAKRFLYRNVGTIERPIWITCRSTSKLENFHRQVKAFVQGLMSPKTFFRLLRHFLFNWNIRRARVFADPNTIGSFCTDICLMNSVAALIAELECNSNHSLKGWNLLKAPTDTDEQVELIKSICGPLADLDAAESDIDAYVAVICQPERPPRSSPEHTMWRAARSTELPVLRELLGGNLGPAAAVAAARERDVNGTSSARVRAVRAAYLAAAGPGQIGFLDAARNSIPTPFPVETRDEKCLFNAVLVGAVERGNDDDASAAHRHLHDLLVSHDGRGGGVEFNLALREAASKEDVLDWEGMTNDFNLVVYSSGLAGSVEYRGVTLSSAGLRRKSSGNLLTYAKNRAESIITRSRIGNLPDYATMHVERSHDDNHVDQVPSTVSVADALVAGLPSNVPGIDLRTLNNQMVYVPPPVEFEQPINCVCGVAINNRIEHESGCPIAFIKTNHRGEFQRTRNESVIRATLRWFAAQTDNARMEWERRANDAAAGGEEVAVAESEEVAVVESEEGENGGEVAKRPRLSTD